jgi:hypothetical protein
MFNKRGAGFCVLGMSLVLFLVCAMHARYAFAAGGSTEGDAENSAKRALDAGKVSAFDGTLEYVSQEVVEKPVGGADHEILYRMDGPGAGVKSSVQYRIYGTPADAKGRANPVGAQVTEEEHVGEIPQGKGQLRNYHSNLSGSDLAKSVPETFHCMALAGGKAAWSRCYYYPGGGSDVVVVGTTSSSAANEAILITAMGAQTLGAVKP